MEAELETLESDEPDHIKAQWRSLHPELDYESTSLLVRMRRTTRMLTDVMADHAADYDITVADFDILAALYRQGPPRMLTINALARATARTHGSVSIQVDRLGRRGLIVRLAMRDDGRVTRVRLTPKGVGLIEKMIPGFVDLQSNIFSVLSSDERRTLTGFLKRVWFCEPGKRQRTV